MILFPSLRNFRFFILVSAVIIFIVSVVGISRLTVENSFIDYFKDTTEIHQGMKVIDQKLGGTTPLDVIIEIDDSVLSAVPDAPDAEEKQIEDFDDFDEFEEEADNDKYWFTAEKMSLVSKIHDYLESLPETGKVLSLATMLKIAEKLNGGNPLDNFQLALLYKELPEKYKRIGLNPYVSVEHNS